MDERKLLLTQWLTNKVKLSINQLLPLAGDASFRRYFRLIDAQNKTYVVMDAPPERETCDAFIHIAEGLRQYQVRTPTIYAQDIQQGFLLLEDFGDHLLLNFVNKANAPLLYFKAIDVLCQVQLCKQVVGYDLPAFDQTFMLKEMELLRDWFIGALLNYSLTTNEQTIITHFFDHLTTRLSKEPQIFIHRDYHSRNIMCLEENNLGILDFQDAMQGPVSYDLLSLLKDAYIAWDKKFQLDCIHYYVDRATELNILTKCDFQTFYKNYQLTGLQRHTKVVGIFARLFKRDGKAGYLNDIPLVISYLLETLTEFPEYHDFHVLLSEKFVPAFKQLERLEIKEVS